MISYMEEKQALLKTLKMHGL